MGLREWAAKAPIGGFGGIQLYNDRMVYKRETQPLDAVQARVETSGELESRVTVTRAVMLNVVAVALPKKKDRRAVYLTVEGPAFAWLIDVDRKKEADARKFAAKIVDASRKIEAQ